MSLGCICTIFFEHQFQTGVSGAPQAFQLASGLWLQHSFVGMVLMTTENYPAVNTQFVRDINQSFNICIPKQTVFLKVNV